ncbi:beta strand repeat-containing protein [Variovorax sp. PAMC 28711]|uniref:beta strand repeat-containing protein n=1 Tax=Variovorax sp. PAMC 28711 TaxID=1795631 RepID=UPI00078DAF83|nr:hypothetical protein [Variovorax sp. PAMC 28711]AMM24593.1 hypothetical protein AX767_09715 [Variovorax sp. PAMC 28711]
MRIARPPSNRKTAIALTLLGAGLLASQGVLAQEAILNGLGWLTARPGSELDGRTSALVTNNRSPAEVTAAGGKASAGLGIGGSLELIATAQANALGLSSLKASNSQVSVLQNQVQGFVSAVGGAATANTALLSGGTSRRPLTDSRVLVSGNRAADVESVGAKGSSGLGVIGSLQLPGRSAANSVLTDESDLRRVQVSVTNNQAQGVQSVGGAALANASTLARSTAEDLNITQANNTARDIRAGGGTGSVGGGFVAAADLTGVAAANSFAAAGSQVKGARVTQQSNEVNGMWAMGGSALANSVNLADYTGSDLRQYQSLQTGNRATKIEAGGGSGSLAKGALAEVKASASALANSISIQKGDVQGATQHTVTGNTANGVQAIGGAAAANSVWLQDSTARRSNVTVTGNTANDINTAGGRATLGGGVVGDFERSGRAMANSLALDNRSTLDNVPVTITNNTARGVQGSGGLASANSAMLSDGRVQNSALGVTGNTATNVRANGFSNSVGGGLVYSNKQSAIALANSLGVFGSDVDAASVAITNNTARDLSAQGGLLVANSVSVEKGEGARSRLSAPVTLSGNSATSISTGASSMSGPLNSFGSASVARAAANAVVLHDNAQVDAGSTLSLTGNRATQIGAVGGTALVNALGAYRGARIDGSPITLTDNTANNVSTGGGYNQVAGIGDARNGILVANGLYMEGNGAVRLSGSPLSIRGNTARSLDANGGRINANAVAINADGNVQGSAATIANNRAESVKSEGKEGTVFNVAVIDRGVGYASANALQVMGALRASSTQLVDNFASRVTAEKGVVLANSVMVDNGAITEGTTTTVTGNTATDVSVRDGKTAVANSVYNEGRIAGSSLTITGNRGSAQGDDDVSANSVRNRSGASMAGSTIAITGNQGSVGRKGSINSVENGGTLGASNVTIAGNRGSVQNGGIANSVINNGGGTIAGGQIHILGNQGTTQDGGTVNSVTNQGRIGGSQIVISGNTGSARGGGLVNSVNNRGNGNIAGSNISIIGNRGSANGGGTVNSVDNQGVMSGRIAIIGNQGSSTQGGVVNSVVNRGVLAGNVVIAGNRGSAIAGGTSNSVINRGVITGSVSIIGNQSTAGVGMTTGSVRTTGGVLAGSAGVTGNVPWAANVGMTVVKPSTGVVNRTVTVGPAVTVLSM